MIEQLAHPEGFEPTNPWFRRPVLCPVELRMHMVYLGGTSVDPLFSARVPKVLSGTYISAPHNPTSSHRGCHSTQLRGGRSAIPCDRVYATLPPRIMVGVLRFELRVSWSQTRRDGQTSLYPEKLIACRMGLEPISQLIPQLCPIL